MSKVRQDQQNVNKRYNQQSDSRPTIGLFIARSSDLGYINELRAGVTAFGREQDANVFTISGEELRSPFGFEAQRNVLYELVTAENIDGLVITGSTGQYVSLGEFQDFCERYRPLPMVTVTTALEGISCISVDNGKGMREALIHLIEVHGYRQIAFIRGPQDSADSEERYRVYTEVLAECNIPLDPALVAPGNFEADSGREAIEILLSQRGVKFEALVAVDDETAMGALEALRERGIRVPDEVALVGFDDIQRSRFALPPLTTVRQPIYELGWRAAEMVWLQLQEEAVPERLILPTTFVMRQSCGCLLQVVRQAAAGLNRATFPEHSGVETFEAALAARREDILVMMGHALGRDHGSGFDLGWTEQLLDAFVAELKGQAPGSFLRVLNTTLHQTLGTGENLDNWQGVLSMIRRQVLPYLADNELLFRAEDLWQQARALIGEVGQQVQAHRTLQIEQQAVVLRNIGEALITTFDLAELIEVVAGERAAALTRQLLAFSRQQMLQPRVLNLNSVVANVETMLQRLIGEDLKLTTLLDPTLAPVTADPGQIEQIIVNLAVNARDAMPQGGKLTLATINVYLDKDYARQNVGVKAGPYVMLRVSDTGRGMDAATQVRLFEPFFTTKPQGQGTGLGLATVFGIVQQSGGHISVSSKPGQGTTFKIYLPQSEQAVEKIKPDWVLPRPSLAGSETILLVEDDSGVRSATRQFLEKYAYTVLEASHGLEALRLCQQHPGPIHLLITDVVMPGMNGRELVERLASIRPELPVLYVSGYTDSAIIRHGVSEATITLLQKPFTADALAHKVREMLDLRSRV